MGDDSSSNLGEQVAWLIFLRWYRVLNTKFVPQNLNDLRKHLQHQDQRGSLMLLPGNFLDPRVLHPSEEERRHPCIPQDLGAILFTQSSSVLFPERLELPFPSEEILSSYEDVVSSSKDQTLRG